MSVICESRSCACIGYSTNSWLRLGTWRKFSDRHYQSDAGDKYFSVEAGAKREKYGKQYALFCALQFMELWERNREWFQVAYRLHECEDVSCGHLNGNQEMLLETLPGLLQQTCARRGKVL